MWIDGGAPVLNNFCFRIKFVWLDCMQSNRNIYLYWHREVLYLWIRSDWSGFGNSSHAPVPYGWLTVVRRKWWIFLHNHLLWCSKLSISVFRNGNWCRWEFMNEYNDEYHLFSWVLIGWHSMASHLLNDTYIFIWFHFPCITTHTHTHTNRAVSFIISGLVHMSLDENSSVQRRNTSRTHDNLLFIHASPDH